MWYLWILTKANKDVIPFSLPTSKAYVEFIGTRHARIHTPMNAVKSRPWLGRPESPQAHVQGDQPKL
jgi:hypothetical protein